MLKIDVIESPTAITFVLHGKLSDRWAVELNTVWRESLKTVETRQIVVDLKQTTGIDRAGIQLLREMSDAGVTLLTSGVLTGYLVESFCKRWAK